MTRRRILSTAAVASLLVAPLFVLSPAHATTIDVSGATFSFGNDVDEQIGEGAAIGDSFNYSNVATVGGVQIDAVVTLVDASASSLGDSWYNEIDSAEIEQLNAIDDNAVDAAGCYSNAAFVTAMENNEAYGELSFVAGDLLPGLKASAVDEFYGDPAYEDAINSSVDLCNGPTTGFITIRVDFEVNGAPVTLNNLSIFAGDIDGLQSLTLSDPKPTSVTVSGQSELEIQDTADSVTLSSPDVSSDEGDPTALNFVGEAQYDGVSSLTYEFALAEAYSGGISMRFESFFNPDGSPAASLANTGTDVNQAGIAGFAALAVGFVVVAMRRVRRNRV